MTIRVTKERQKILDLFAVGNVMAFGNSKQPPFSIREPAHQSTYVVTAHIMNEQVIYAEVMDYSRFPEFVAGPAAQLTEDGSKMPRREDIRTLTLVDARSYRSSEPTVLRSILTDSNIVESRLREFRLTGKNVTFRTVEGKVERGQIVSTDLFVATEFGQRALFKPHRVCHFDAGIEKRIYEPALHKLKA